VTGEVMLPDVRLRLDDASGEHTLTGATFQNGT
jgi:hypothetical protein